MPTDVDTLIRANATSDPAYRPYCLRCSGLVRMALIEPLLWHCRCGAVHDSRRYSVGTWDTNEQAYTPQAGVPAFNLTIFELRRALKALRRDGYSAHRFRDADGSHDDNDWTVLVERTDGMPEAEILEGRKR